MMFIMFEYVDLVTVKVISLVTMVAILLWSRMMNRRKYNYPPGPRGLPFLGNLLQVNLKTIHKQVFHWSKKYGPVLTVRIGRIPVIYVNSIESAMEVLVERTKDFAARISLPSIDLLTDGGKDIAFSSYGPTWKLHRKIATRALRHYITGNGLENRIKDALQTAFEEMDRQTGEFDPAHYINFTVANILTGICFGGKYKFNDKDIIFLLKKEDELFQLLGTGSLEDFFPGLRYVYKSESFKQLEECIKAVRIHFIENNYREAKTCFQRERVQHFCDALILARLEASENAGHDVMESLTENHLMQTISDIFYAGIDTSRFTLNWVINHMIAFPDIQEKVQEEIDRVVGNDRLPNMKDRDDLCYTEAVLHESMRLASVAPTGVVHMTSCDTVVAGYKIAKGTAVVINHWALHHDPSAWDDVDRFLPDRYLDKDGKLGPKPKNWLPFSAGKRKCLGEFIARPELHLLFASLMQRYEWKMVSGKCANLSATGSCFGRICKPYKVIIEKRIN